MELLSKKESLQYIQDILHVPLSEVPYLSEAPVSSGTKLSFLETIIRAFLEREPFQSIYLMSHDVTCRRRPTWDEIKRDLLLGRGGLCYWLNTFMYALLSSLGYDVSMTYSTFNVGTHCPNNHVIVLAHDLVASGSLHLVDVGLGYYIPRAISLDFKSESPEYTDSFLTYKFQRESESMMYLLKKVTQPVPAPPSGHAEQQPQQEAIAPPDKDRDESGENLENVNMEKKGNEKQITLSSEKHNNETIEHVTWQQMYFFNPMVALKDLAPFYDCFDFCFTDITKLSTHTSPRAMCWPGGRFVALVNSKLIQEVEQGQLKKTSIIEIASNPPPSADNKRNSITRVENGHEVLTSKSLDETVSKNSDDDDDDRKNSAGRANLDELSDFKPLIQAYADYFPQFPQQMVRAALKN